MARAVDILQFRELRADQRQRFAHIGVVQERDHDEAEAHHAAVGVLGRQWLNDRVLDGDARRLLRAHLAALALIYRDHIAIEDGDLFPAAARLLTRADLHDIGHQVAARRRLAPSNASSAMMRPAIETRRS
jgi:hypothetical protein